MKGNSGLTGIEVFGWIIKEDDDFFLEIDFKNESNKILKI